jgi:hypothetical protein
MHFKQNRKANQNVGRGHSRSWFIAIDVGGSSLCSPVTRLSPSSQDWIHETAADVKGKGSADGARRLTVKETVAAEAVKRDTELRSMHVVIPPGDEAKTIKCPICKEAIDPEFLEEDEEWVWRNALKKDDKVGVTTLVRDWALIIVLYLRYSTRRVMLRRCPPPTCSYPDSRPRRAVAAQPRRRAHAPLRQRYQGHPRLAA